jgi:hypothetical protein
MDERRGDPISVDGHEGKLLKIERREILRAKGETKLQVTDIQITPKRTEVGHSVN